MNIQNTPKYVLYNALNNAQKSLNNQPLVVSGGQLYVSNEKREAFGAKITGSWRSPSDFEFSLDTSSTVYGTALRINSDNESPLLQISGIKDITQTFVVGAARQDARLNSILQAHKDTIRDTAYRLTGSDFNELIRSIGLAAFMEPHAFTSLRNMQLTEDFKQNPFLVVKDIAHGEVIYKDMTYRYVLTIDQARLQDFLRSNMATSWLRNITSLSIWVNQKTHTIEQIQVEYSDAGWTYSLRARLRWGNYSRQDQQLSQPAVSVDELLQLFKTTD